jgi:hypothetical protein
LGRQAKQIPLGDALPVMKDRLQFPTDHIQMLFTIPAHGPLPAKTDYEDAEKPTFTQAAQKGPDARRRAQGLFQRPARGPSG